MLVRSALCAIFLVGAAGPASAGEAHDALAALDDADRRARLADVVDSAGHDCPTVSRDIYLGDGEEAGYWTVRCAGTDYIVRIENGGAMKTATMSCKTAEALDIACWRPF